MLAELQGLGNYTQEITHILPKQRISEANSIWIERLDRLKLKDDKKLCVAGIMSDYAAIVDRETFEYTTLEDLGEKLYWEAT